MLRTFKYKIDREKLKDSLRIAGLSQVNFSFLIGKKPVYLAQRSSGTSKHTVPSYMQKSINDQFKKFGIDGNKIGLFYEVPVGISNRYF